MTFGEMLQALIQHVGNIYQLSTNIGWNSARTFELARGAKPSDEEQAQIAAHFATVKAELGAR